MIVKLKLTDIKPYEKNPRISSNIAELQESIRNYGYVEPIVVDEDNVILAGHSRYQALLGLGWDEVDVIKEVGMTESQKISYRILDNKVSELGLWDYDKLMIEYRFLSIEDQLIMNSMFPSLAPTIRKPVAEDNDDKVEEPTFNWQENYQNFMKTQEVRMETNQINKFSNQQTITCPECGETFEVKL